MRTLNLRKFIAIALTLSLIAATQSVAFASVPQVVSAPGTNSNLKFKQELEVIVVNAFDGLAEELAPQVTAEITPQVESIAADLEKAVADLETTKNEIETQGFALRTAEYPPEAVINSIPSQALGQVRAEVEADIKTSIDGDFLNSQEKIKTQVQAMMTDAAPAITAQLEPALKALVPKVHQIIEKGIEDRIEGEIIKAMPQLMTKIPDDMKDMSPEEIAAKMKAEIRPGVEAQVRPEFEETIKNQVDNLMVEKIKNPMVQKFSPKVLSLDTTVYDQYIDQLPSYLERVVSKSYIKSVVSSNVASLQAKLPAMVDETRSQLDVKIDAYVMNTIDKEAKIYIGQSYVKAPIEPQIVNNRMLVPFRAIATALGAEVEWKYKERQVVMKKDGTEIVLTIDNDVVLVNGRSVKLDAAAKIYSGSTIVPLRFIAETFNMDVDWQKEWKMVTIESK